MDSIRPLLNCFQRRNLVHNKGERKIPVLIHRALFGSLERFTGILLEHYAGKLPIWLSPTNVAIVTINDKCNDYAKSIKNQLTSEGISSKLDLRNEKIGYKIREHSNTKIPLIFVIGEKEMETNKISVRKLGSREIESSSLKIMLEYIKNEKNKF